MIETSRPEETAWNADLSARLERKTRTALKKLRVLRRRRSRSPNMMDEAGSQGTVSDRSASVRIKVGGGIEVVFIVILVVSRRPGDVHALQRISGPEVSGMLGIVGLRVGERTNRIVIDRLLLKPRAHSSFGSPTPHSALRVPHFSLEPGTWFASGAFGSVQTLLVPALCVYSPARKHC